jgi:beta-galactosidase
MQALRFDRRCFTVGDQPVYLYSGEFHYFRVPRADWRRRMELFKEAGGNCLATYIPWLLHEPEEGRWRFGGGQLDLEGFLQEARQAGLYVLARPGPYQYSELLYDGLPGWLCEQYPQLLAHDRNGRPFRQSSVSYLHPVFIEKVRRWFDVVCPIIARQALPEGGPVALVQLDNEVVGIHEWFDSLDYNATTMGFGQPDGRYPRFLERKYNQLAALNRSYSSAYTSFAAVEPPRFAPSPEVAEIRRMKDYFDFYLETIAEYLQSLAEMVRAHGITLPLVHNSANPHMNAYFLETAAALGEGFLLGSDHYYNLGQNWAQNHPTPQYALRAFVSLEQLRLMGYPPTVFELPGGSCSNWPPLLAEDAQACYLANLALGMKGHNFYIFTGGPNPPGAGATTDLYDYDAGIGANGEIRPLYHVQRSLGELLRAHPWLVTAERETDCRVGLDFEYARAHTYWQARGDWAFIPHEAHEFLHSGVLTSAFCAGCSPGLVDLGNDEWIRDTSTPLVVPVASSLGIDKQRRLVRFLRAGGKALILPVLPRLDENLEPCRLLADFLGAPELFLHAARPVRLNVGGVTNVLANGRVCFSAGLPAGAQLLGSDERSGQPVAWKLDLPGDGAAIWLGLSWLHAMHEHRLMLAALLGQLGLRQKILSSNPNVWMTLWRSGDQALLFALNLFSAPQTTEVRLHLRPQAGAIDLGRLTVGPVTVLPVGLDLRGPA